ncbi:hypothetical protein GCM10029964_061230 [Kibdelosporangium lantanae]
MNEVTAEFLVQQWPSDLAVGKHETFLIYTPAVDRLTGEALTKPRATAIAEHILRHNQAHPHNPMLVFSDESAIDSGSRTCSLASITGDDLGDPGLGRMSDWTLTVVTPAVTFPTANPLVSFVHTTNPTLSNVVQEWIGLYSATTEPTAVDARTAAAHLCLTPRRELARARNHATHNLTRLRDETNRINTTLGHDIIITGPHLINGLHLTLSINPTFLQHPLIGSLKQIRRAINGEGATGLLTVLPDHIFGSPCPHNPTRPLTLRARLDIPDTQLIHLTTALESLATTLHTTSPHHTPTQLLNAGYPAQRLARTLTNLRDRARMTPQDAARAADITTHEITLYENGNAPTKAVLHALLTTYGVPTHHFGHYEQLRTHATTQQWWDNHPDATWLSMEHHATHIRTFHPTHIPVLLRTEDYDRTILETTPTDIDITTELNTRRRRRHRLTIHSPQLHALIPQPALHDLPQTQLDHLAEISTQDNITVSILPATYPLRVTATAFTLLTFPHDVADYVQTEDKSGVRTSQHPENIVAAQMAFDTLAATAMTPDASRAFLRAYAALQPTTDQHDSPHISNQRRRQHNSRDQGNHALRDAQRHKSYSSEAQDVPTTQAGVGQLGDTNEDQMSNTPLQLPFNGKLLREYRERAGLTQRDLAFLCGLSRYQISRWETGTAKPARGALAPLVRGLNKALQQSGGSKHLIHLDDLLEYPGD